MPHKCNYCEEIKKCRRRYIYSVGYPSMYYGIEWICKDCDDYRKFLYKKSKDEGNEAEKKRINEFIKGRNAFLKDRYDINQEGTK